jgi:hypothetical protein
MLSFRATFLFGFRNSAGFHNLKCAGTVWLCLFLACPVNGSYIVGGVVPITSSSYIVTGSSTPGLPVSINPSCFPLGPNGGTTGNVNTSGADFIAVSVSYVGPPAPAITDNKGNGVPACLTPHSYAGAAFSEICYWTNPTVGVGHAFTVTGASSFSGICIEPWANMKTAGVFDAGTDSGSGNTVNTCSTGSVSPSAGNKVVLTAVTVGNAATPYTVDSSFSVDGQYSFSGGVNLGQGVASLIQTPNGSAVNPTWTVSAAGFTACSIAAFKGQ